MKQKNVLLDFKNSLEAMLKNFDGGISISITKSGSEAIVEKISYYEQLEKDVNRYFELVENANWGTHKEKEYVKLKEKLSKVGKDIGK